LQASNIWKEWTSLQILINNSRIDPFGLASRIDPFGLALTSVNKSRIDPFCRLARTAEGVFGGRILDTVHVPVGGYMVGLWAVDYLRCGIEMIYLIDIETINIMNAITNKMNNIFSWMAIINDNIDRTPKMSGVNLTYSFSPS
jgi:hypothetical protein